MTSRDLEHRLISTESPLRKIPVQLSRRQILYLDGIRLAAEMADLAHQRLTSTLPRDPHRDPHFEVGHVTVSAMLDAWAVIDSTHRMRELLQSLPGMKQKIPVLQLFYRGTAVVEGMRHVVQHFRSGIGDFEKGGVPLWGVLSWLAESGMEGPLPQICTLTPGTYYRGVVSESQRIDLWQQQFDGRPQITLRVLQYSVCLDEVIDRMVGVIRLLETGLQQHTEEGKTLGSDMYSVFQLQPIEDGEEPPDSQRSE